MSGVARLARPGLVGLLAAVLLLSAGARAIEAEATVAGRKLLLPVPAAMCEVQPHLESDRAGFEFHAQAIGSDYALVALFVPCDRMTALRRREVVTRFIAVVAPRRRGEVRPTSDASRAAFVQRTAKDDGKVEIKAVAEQAARRGQRSSFFGSSTSFDRIGAVDEDAAAVFVAFLGTMAGTPPVTASAIGGFTLVGDLAIGYAHYERGGDEALLRRLLGDARVSMTTLIAANPLPAGARPGSGWFEGFDWPRIGVAVGIGSIAVVFVAGLALIVRRRRGW